MKRVIKKLAHKIAPSVVDSVKHTQELPKITSQLQTLETKLDNLHSEVSVQDNRLARLKALAAEVEPYQPAYGLANVIDAPRRTSQDRCIAIESALRPLAGKRILDIGSSLGYVSFYLADRGARVEGWDLSPNNVEVSRQISELNGINVDFKVKKIDASTVATIAQGKYDAVIILSVFHHIIHHQGLKATQQLVKELFERTPIMIVELAKKGEDPTLFWDESLPEDELAIFDLVKDEVNIKKIGDFGNHLSSKTRPLYMVAKKGKVQVGNHEYAYDRSTSAAYKDSPVANQADVHRRYYFAKDYIIKEYSFVEGGSPENLYQIVAEINAFVNILGRHKIYHAPEMIDFAINDSGAKIVIKRIEGELLSDLKKPLSEEQAVKVMHDILKTLADLESHGVSHNDVRSWNAIHNQQGVWLIDYGYLDPWSSDRDVISLLWLLAAVLRHEREPYQRYKDNLPKLNNLENAKLKALYDQVVAGEYSPSKLLKIFKA